MRLSLWFTRACRPRSLCPKILRSITRLSSRQFGRFPWVLRFAPKALKNNHEMVMAAIAKDPRALQHASEELRSNHEVVMAAVCKDPCSLQFASEEIKNNYDFVMRVVSKDGEALQHASEELRSNHDIAMAAVCKDPCFLQFASKEIKSNFGFVMRVVSQDGETLQHASKELRNNHEIVMAAVSQSPWALQFASEELRNNHDICHGSSLQEPISSSAVCVRGAQEQLWVCHGGSLQGPCGPTVCACRAQKEHWDHKDSCVKELEHVGTCITRAQDEVVWALAWLRRLTPYDIECEALIWPLCLYPCLSRQISQSCPDRMRVLPWLGFSPCGESQECHITVRIHHHLFLEWVAALANPWAHLSPVSTEPASQLEQKWAK